MNLLSEPRTDEAPAIAAASWPAAEPAENLATDPIGGLPPFPHLFRHPLQAAAWTVRALFGIASLLLLLAVMAAIPVVNLYVLGYLLEAEGRVARSGKLRHAFPLLDVAPRIGAIALCIWLWAFPLRLMAGAAADAELIDPGGRIAAGWRTAVVVASVLVGAHLCLALARGGGLGCFFRPLKNARWFLARLRAGGYWKQAEANVSAFAAQFRIRHHFWLGMRGLLGAFLWLAPPSLLFAAANRTEGGPILVTLVGGLCLVAVLCWLPFLHARFAAENRLAAMRELGTIRRLYRQAPLAWLIAVTLVYVLTLPLYLLKVRLPPQDAMWLVTLVFLVSIFPARIVTGWAYHRAVRRGRPAWFGLRWMCTALMLPVVGAYVFLLFFAQFIGEHGKGALFEHHAFLLPVPF